MSMLTILIIEDDNLTANLYKHLLERAGYAAVLAPDTESATDLLYQKAIDCIILDYNLPDSIGTTWLSQLRQIPEFESLPVVLVSQIERDADLTQDKYVWFMEKPRSPEHIVTAVNHTISHFKG